MLTATEALHRPATICAASSKARPRWLASRALRPAGNAATIEADERPPEEHPPTRGLGAA